MESVDTAAAGRPDVGRPPTTGAAPLAAYRSWTPLEERVVATVAALLQAGDGAQMLGALTDLVEGCGGRVDTHGREPLAAIRALPDALQVPDGREMTLGPVLRALAAAALERASGVLSPTREPGPWRPVATDGPQEVLVTLDLGDLGSVRAEFGDPAARWLTDKLRRTLRSLLGGHDRVLRYPANRFLVVLASRTPDQAASFARRVAWEWDAYLGRALRVDARVEPVADGDLAAGLRRISSSPDVR